MQTATLTAMWERAGDQPWSLKGTLRFLTTDCRDRSERLADVFERNRHAALAGARPALDHLSALVEHGVIATDATVAEAIAELKRLHRSGNHPDERDWQSRPDTETRRDRPAREESEAS